MKRLALALLALGCCVARGQADDDIEYFEKKVRPLLAERCEGCHSAARGKTSGGLALDTRDGWVQGGDSGPPITPRDPAASLLIRAVRYGNDGPQMPPEDDGGKLTDAEIAILVEWVERGAPDPRVASARIGGMTVEEAQRWWAFQPLQATEPPTPRQMQRVENDLDRFVLAALERENIPPAEPADRRTWIRRVTFDLTGLPPTVEEVEAFLSDASEQAFLRVVDRLLSSPSYGQRWARHWLDVARYADYYDANPATRTASCELTEAWRYRDWVVDALNSDLPFDQFVVHQIAGDLLPSPNGAEIYPAGLIATTFLSNGVWDRGDADKEKIVSDMVDDNIDVVGKAFLGLTLGCARCHDHKFDPIATSDYYALAGIFYSSHILKDLGAKGGEYTLNRVPLVPATIVAQRAQQLQRIADVQAQLAALEKLDPPPPDMEAQRLALVSESAKLQSELLPEPPLAMAVQEGGTPGGLFPGIQDVPIHIRGSYTRLGPVVPRGLPQFLAGSQQSNITTGSGRRELAEWIASPENPLTARVIVNRVWQWHFGEGLVRTPSNFGKLGVPPTHPELLDWLAQRFIEQGWSLKWLHRQILLSSTYRQSSYAERESIERDPENRWLGRYTPRRLDAESLRDALLHVSGQLDLMPGGAADDDFTIRRRSLYVQTARWDRGSYAILFDAANPDSSTERRTTSTVAPQALLLLNHPFVQQQAQHLAARLLRAVPDDSAARVDLACRLLFARPATDAERAVARELISGNHASEWADWAHVLLCSNEFCYVD